MNLRITPAPLRGMIRAIPSKSEAHRALICAALAERETRLICRGSSEDIEATTRCLNAMGARIERDQEILRVQPINFEHLPKCCTADCGESGSTLRFLLPLAAALGIQTDFVLHGRLAKRPITPLDAQLIRGGATLERTEENILRLSGQLVPGDYTLPGNVSSQYITGLLLGLSLLKGKSSLEITGTTESAGYIEMTLRMLERFHVVWQRDEHGFRFLGGPSFRSPGELEIEGDWSNAAFWLCAGAMPGCLLTVRGLDFSSLQGDRSVICELTAMGAKLSSECGCFTVCERVSTDHDIDAAPIPDLIPALSALACTGSAQTRVLRAGRLRIKESDRLRSIASALNALGGRVTELEDGLILEGVGHLAGGTVDAMNDHRIAMMAAIASCVCRGAVTILGAEAVNKSYPAFWTDFQALGGRIEYLEGGAQ